jgi:hypothetical protein
MALLGASAAVVAVLLVVMGPWQQNPAYHNFAGDGDAFLGVPNARNVLSNAPFLLVGALGAAVVWRRPGAFLDPAEAWPYFTFFVGVGVTAFGSAYYHWAPMDASGRGDDARLVWDRLPIAMAFMALFAAVIGEHVSVRAGLILLGPLMAVGLGSVFFWSATGELGPYYFVQLYPLIAIPLLLILYPPRYTREADLLVGVGWYAAAKVCELGDQKIYDLLGGFVSGHTVKHLLSAVGAFWVVRMLYLRRPAPVAIAAAP